MQPARPGATAALVIVTSLAFLLMTFAGALEWAAIAGGFIPARFSGSIDLPGAAPAWLTPLTATLVHASFLHLIFNMVLLGYCGRLVEEALGARRLLILYGIGRGGGRARRGWERGGRRPPCSASLRCSLGGRARRWPIRG